MELLAIPFCPTHAEHVYLQGRQILNDQMDFLLAHFPRNSVLCQRVEKVNPYSCKVCFLRFLIQKQSGLIPALFLYMPEGLNLIIHHLCLFRWSFLMLQA